MKKTLFLISAIAILLSGTVNMSADALQGCAVPPKKVSATSVPPSDWAIESIEKAKEISLINGNYNFPFAIVREDFCNLIYSYLEIACEDFSEPINSKPFNDTNNPHIAALKSYDIVSGVSETEFAPQKPLTREEAAAIICRLINKMYSDSAVHELYYEFEDNSEISDWAMASVQKLCNMNIMNGVGENRFAPKDIYTAEQAVATLMRVYTAFADSDTDIVIIGGADGPTQIVVGQSATFADKLNKYMPNDRNYMFSPLSLKTALIMAANGASGDTLAEILKTTNTDDLDKCNSDIKSIMDKYAQSDILQINISNSAWVNSDNTPQRFNAEYTKKLADNFNAVSDVVTNENAVNKINSWVNGKTNGKIPSIISDGGTDFNFMLVNAVYFKGRWQYEFNKNATHEDTFVSRDGKKSNVSFMNRTGWIDCALEDGVTVVELPYAVHQAVFDENGEYIETKKMEDTDVSMYLMMSEKDYDAERILNNASLGSKYVALYVPKFKIECDTQMRDILKMIGINKAFTVDAEFDGIYDKGNGWIDSLLHKTYIEVDENGTEAAAVTGLAVGGMSMPPKPIEVKFNKPFTFVIKDNISGEILFMGEYAFAE